MSLRKEEQPFPILAETIATRPLLTAEEEVELGALAFAGNMEARNELIEANLRFVFKLARKFPAKGRAEYEEIISAGLEGLTHAAERYNPEMGTRFTTYARFWIEHCIKRYLNKIVPAMHVPTGQIQGVRSLHRDLVKNYQKYRNGSLTEESLAELRGESKSVVHRIMAVKSAFSVVSYDSEEGQVYMNMSSEKEEEDKQAIELPANIEKAISELTDTQRDILQRYFGINCSPQTLQDISMIYILSRERIRQIKDEALAIIREKVGEGGL